MTKKVSVVMCTYNGEKYLREQIDSILGQTYPIYELIIQDDRSTDNTVAIIKEYMQSFSFIKLFINEKNKGFRKNFLSAYLLASGDFVCSCDQDDIWVKNKVEILVNNIENNLLIFSNSELFGTGYSTLQYKQEPFFSPYVAILKPFVLGHQMMFNRCLLSNIQYFIDYGYSFDYFVFVKAIIQGEVKYINEPLVKWRRHNSATTYIDEKNVVNSKYILGYINALKSLVDKNKRKRVSIYFQGLNKYLYFKDKSLGLIVQLMSKNKVINIFMASIICLFNSRKIYSSLSLKTRIRSLFVPLFFIDKYGKNLVEI